MTGIVLMDGGHETELKKYVGSDFEGHPLWICRYLVDNPDAVRKVCQEYILAGSEMILTNTYQATVDGFMSHIGYSREKAIELIQFAVKICKEEVESAKKSNDSSTAVKVVGFCGPYGAHLHDGSEYAGGHYVDQMTTQQLADWHRPQVQALLQARADCLLFGTIPSLKEADAIILLMKEYPDAKYIICFSAQNEETISHGEKMSDVAKTCWDQGSGQMLAVGVNCLHPRLATALVRSVRQLHPHIPLLIKPNTTELFNTTNKQWETSDDDKSLNEYCREWLELGIEYISGCCRTSCQDIKDFKEEILNYKMKSK